MNIYLDVITFSPILHSSKSINALLDFGLETGMVNGIRLALSRQAMTSQCMPCAWARCPAEKHITKRDCRSDRDGQLDLRLDVESSVDL
ncbi:hypothetical protein TNCV_2610361 [Trichonephila clavipes]|nr:hypothetical protein TNCV_2610361 [Trichonephila clavipes]